MREPTVNDFRYGLTAFPSCCGAAVVSGLSLVGTHPSVPDRVNWDVLPDSFIKDLKKAFDKACMYNGSTTQYPGAALVCVLLPPHSKRPEYYSHHDKIAEILSATGWEPGPVSVSAHGGYLNQFWFRKSPRNKS